MSLLMYVFIGFQQIQWTRKDEKISYNPEFL